MTIQDFLRDIQGYYNLRYSLGTLKIIFQYLEKQPLLYDVLFKEVVLSFSGQYKTLPDVAIFEKIVKNKIQYAKDYMPRDNGKSLLEFGFKQDSILKIEG